MEYERNADKEGYFNIHKYTTDHYPGFVGVPHFHNSTEIIFVAGGNFSVYLGGESRILHEGEIAYIDALTPHHTVTRSEVGELECYVLVVSPRYLSGVVGVENNSFGGFLEKNGGFSEIIEFVRWGYSSLSGMNDEMRLGFSTALFGIMKKHYGVTLKALIDSAVINSAKGLISNTNMSVKEISAYLKFPNSNAFINFFKYHENTSPAAFRKQFTYVCINSK